MTDFSKVLRLGTIPTGGGAYMSVYVHVRYQGDRLSLTGVEGPRSGGNCVGSCGQIDMHLRPERFHKYAEGWNTARVRQLLNVWDRWHLNDMRAECEHQRQRGETWKTHPSAVCPDCGYKLGHAWLKEDVPADVLEWLQGLPDTDRQPAWV